MFLPFLSALRANGVPVSLREYLGFLQALSRGLVILDTEGFYHLARLTLVKDEGLFDRFDRAFAQAFSGLEALGPEAVLAALELPRDWLDNPSRNDPGPEERARIEALGGFDRLIEALRARLAEQQGRHQGGSKWIGTGGTSPFGAHGYNPEGVRIGQQEGRHGRAVKVWDRREFRNLDDQVELGTRTIKLALRRLRRWVREGAAEELDLDGTIRATARQGWLDVRTRPERRNAARVLLLLDAGGSMDAHVKVVEELFSAARSEFHSLTQYYFHNCVYDHLWQDNRRRWTDRTATTEVLNRLGPDHVCILVGDAAMSPYEISHAGGANEHLNEEPGALWLGRLCAQWPRLLWINPVPEAEWRHTASNGMIRAIIGAERMVPMTLAGLDAGMRQLAR